MIEEIYRIGSFSCHDKSIATSQNGDILAHGEMLSALWNSRDDANVKENPFDIGKIIIRNSYP